MIKIVVKEFYFEIKNINCFSIEDKICDYCNIGYCNSSAFEPKLSSEKAVGYHNVHIFGSAGTVDCRICISQINTTSSIKVEVTNISVKRQH